jgi:predicted nucleic acid-binding protein
MDETNLKYYFDANALVKYYHIDEQTFQKRLENLDKQTFQETLKKSSETELQKQLNELKQHALHIRRLVSNEKPILISPLTIIEFLSVLMKANRKKELKKRTIKKIIKDVEKNISTVEETSNCPFYLIAFPENIFLLAKDILLKYSDIYAIGSNDALHLAIIQNLALEAVMVTSDNSMQKVCERLTISFYDPEIR